MRQKLISTIVGFSVVLLCLLGAPAYGGGGRGGGGGGHGGGHAGVTGGVHAGFSGGARAGGVGRGYSGAVSSRSGGSYGARHYSSGISTGRYGSYHSSGQRYYAPRSSTRTQIHRPSPTSQNTSRQFTRSLNYSGSYYVPQDRSEVGFARKSDIQSRNYSGASKDLGQQRVRSGKSLNKPDSNWSRQNLHNKQRLDSQTQQRLRNWQGKTSGWSDARRNHEDHWRNRRQHHHDWWNHHCDAIVLVGWGYWGWYDGGWYPAWGYDPYYSYYDYNGPIYGYGGLQPDEVIAAVQTALQQLGYYPYAVDGVLGPLTEEAIANYQGNYGLPVTGGIDPPTVRSLGLTI